MLSPASLVAEKPTLPKKNLVKPQLHRAFVLKLNSDLARLRSVRSMETKNVLKQDLLSEYQDYLAPLLSRQVEPHGHDEVVVWCALWSIDVGNFKQGMALALLAMETGMRAPDGFKRSLSEVLTENLVHYCLDNKPIHYLDDLETLRLKVEQEDMQDSVKSKLFKALGIAYFELDSVKATQYLERSLHLNPTGGAKVHLNALTKYHASKQAQAVPKAKAKAQRTKQALIERNYTLPTNKAAKLVGVSVPTFLRWAKVYDLPAMRVTCGTGLGFRFDPQDVENLKQTLIVR
ncbi:phage terminase small subunit [Thiofilum flexile]|uniref:phage terminase small subunit n=1 Tax=Thiofilum flexile TaxID=125627 RepID=UPI00036C7134|nr:phage terminase small subunit [Thiofilum flexile]